MGMVTKVGRGEAVAKISDDTGEIRDLVRHRHPPTDSHAVASDLASLIKRVEASSVSEIDRLTADLQMLREKLEGEGARMQRELAEYAAFGELTLQSMKVISECLRNRFPKAQRETAS